MESSQPLRKRGIRKPDEWKQNVRKKLFQPGKQYVSTMDIAVPAKKVKNTKDCKEKCKFKCSIKITDEERNHIFVDFYDNRDKNRQYDYISKTTICDKINMGTDSKRKRSFKYRLFWKMNQFKCAKNSI